MTDHVAFLFPVIDLIDEQEGMATPHGALMDALKASQNFPPALQALARLKDLDIALSMAQKAKSLEPETPSITDTLAWVMYKRGNYASAMPLLREAVQKSPDSPEYHYHLGVLVQPEMERRRSPLVSIPPPRAGIFKASIRPPGYPSAWLHPCIARLRFA